VVNVTTGFWTFERVPLLNSQFHSVGLPVEISVKTTVKGAQPDITLALKFATGACPKT
jgi:hypothetical protein